MPLQLLQARVQVLLLLLLLVLFGGAGRGWEERLV